VSTLVPGDTNKLDDIFVHDMSTATTSLVSVSTDGALANSFSYMAALSADGQHVLFSSFASNLVPADTNGLPDVFVRDLP
jgi:hypothetical protein